MFRLAILLLSSLIVVSTFGIHKESIVTKYKGRHDAAVAGAQEMTSKLQKMPHSQLMIIKLQVSLRNLQSSYAEVMHLEKHQMPFSYDHFLQKYISALEALERAIKEAQNMIH